MVFVPPTMRWTIVWLPTHVQPPRPVVAASDLRRQHVHTRRPKRSRKRVGPGGLDPPTSRLRVGRSNQAELRALPPESMRCPVRGAAGLDTFTSQGGPGISSVY